MRFSKQRRLSVSVLHSASRPQSYWISRHRQRMSERFKGPHCTLWWQGWKASWWSRCPGRQREWRRWDRGWWSWATLFLWITGRPAERSDMMRLCWWKLITHQVDVLILSHWQCREGWIESRRSERRRMRMSSDMSEMCSRLSTLHGCHSDASHMNISMPHFLSAER